MSVEAVRAQQLTIYLLVVVWCCGFLPFCDVGWIEDLRNGGLLRSSAWGNNSMNLNLIAL